MKTVEYNVKKILSEQLGINLERIKNYSLIKQSLGADSLDIIEFIMSIEDFFNIQVKDEKIQDLNTVSDIVNYIKSEKNLVKNKY